MAYTEIALYCDSVAYAAVTQWAASTAYTVGQIRRQLAAPAVANERCFVCVVAGTSGGSEPAWAINATFKGNKVTDNTVTWQECTAHPSLNGDSSNVAIWKTAAGAIAIGTVIKNTAATHYFITTTAGSGTNTEPTWNTTTGATTVDGSVTWTCLGAISSFTTRWAAPAARLAHLLNTNTSWLLNTGMTIYVGDDHSETGGSNWGSGSACQVLCVDHTAVFPLTSANLKTTAVLSSGTTGAVIFWNSAFNGYVYGIQFTCGVTVNSTFQIGTNMGASRLILDNCSIAMTGSGANARLHVGETSNTGGIVICRSCAFSVAVGSQTVSLAGVVQMENCSFTGFGGSTSEIFSGVSAFANITVEGCNLTGVASGGNLVGINSTQPFGYMLFKDCVIPSNLTNIFQGGDVGMGNLVIELSRCDSGTGIYRNERHSADGTELTSTSVVRTGGASDGAIPVAHQISTNANTNNYARIFNAVPFVAWNDVTGTNRTVTVYGIANDSRVPNNDECWCDVEYLGDAGGVQLIETLNPSDKESHITLSGGNLTATGTAGWTGIVRSVDGKAAGKFYWECTFNATAGQSGVGVAIGTLPVAMTFATVSTGHCGVTTDGSVRVNGSFTYNVGGASGTVGFSAISSGTVICVAIDLTAKLLWFRMGAGGNWNNNATYNPATGVGGINIPNVTTGYPTLCFGGADTQIANFGSTAFTGAVPSGFTAGWPGPVTGPSPDGSYARGRALPLATAAALTADTSAWDSAAIARANSTAYVVGDVRKAVSNSGRVFFCTVAGTSGASENAADPVTLNPSDKTSNITLSGGNLTAASSASSGSEAVRGGTGGSTSSKFYFEVTYGGGTWSNNNTGPGIVTLAQALSGYATTSAGGVLIVNNPAGKIYVNGVDSGISLGSFVSATVCIAVDMVNRRFWARIGSGNWNANATYNPVTNVGGIDISSLFSSVAAYPALAFNNSVPTATINFGATTFNQTIPSGFASLIPILNRFANAVDGGVVVDGTAIFRAGCRFKQTVTLSSPQPAQAGYIYTFPKLGRASTTYLLDPIPVLG